MNYLKMYRDKFLNAPRYKEDYSFMLFEMFAQEFVPMIIEEYFAKNKEEIKVPLSRVVSFYQAKGVKVSEQDMVSIIDYAKKLTFYIEFGVLTSNLKEVIDAYYEYLYLEEINLSK